MNFLKLIALDKEDLQIVSAHLQDAVLRVGDMAFLSEERRFVVALNRFNWLSAEDPMSNGRDYERRSSGLRFENVKRVQTKKISLLNKSQVLELLAIDFEESDAPGGYITLTFAGGGAVRLEVDCIEAELRDLGFAWKTFRKPEHPDDRNESEAAG